MQIASSMGGKERKPSTQQQEDIFRTMKVSGITAQRMHKSDHSYRDEQVERKKLTPHTLRKGS